MASLSWDERQRRPGGLGHSGRLWSLVLFGLAFALLAPTPVRGQGQDTARIRYWHQNRFRIPFNTEPGGPAAREVRLYATDGVSGTWSHVATALPADRYFDFSAPRDGWYWFTVQTLDLEGHAVPARKEDFKATLKVCVDTKPPVVSLRQTTTRDGNVGVEWSVQDENLDPDTMRLEYRTPGGPWQPVTITRGASGDRNWNPGVNSRIDVRLQVKDKAGNLGEDVRTISPNGRADPANPGAGPGNPSGPRIVNSRRIRLNYEIREAGKSGVKEVDLWIYEDSARKWTKYERTLPAKGPFEVQVAGEGLWGFTLIARSNVDLAEPPPKLGDLPQIMIDVDETKPEVKIDKPPVVGTGTNTGYLEITWNAKDNKPLGRNPIGLYYREKTDSPWTLIKGNLENTGRYIWAMPSDGLPFQFYVKVDAKDQAGNIGEAITQDPVKVDLVVPKTHVIGIDAVGVSAEPVGGDPP